MNVFLLGFAYGLCVALAIAGLWMLFNAPSLSDKERCNDIVRKE